MRRLMWHKLNLPSIAVMHHSFGNLGPDILFRRGKPMDFSAFTTPNLLQNAALLTILLAFFSYLMTFLSARMLARRRDKLKLVNKRLNEFYGPLYVASQAVLCVHNAEPAAERGTAHYPARLL